MDEMTAFERQMAGGLSHMGGAGRRIDPIAMTRAAATQSPKWRFQSMFSATKFVVAGAIVALFGGFLLVGLLTQPSEESAPVVGASASASPGDLDAKAMTPSVFAIKLLSWDSRNGPYEQTYTEDPATGYITITGVLPGATLDRHLMTEPADAELYGIDASDIDPRALGNLTVVQAQGDGMHTEDGKFLVWTERSWIRLENEDGAWVGTASTHALSIGVAFGWVSWELTGEGDYEGLTMFLEGVQDDGRLRGEPFLAPNVLVGMIVPSASVPAYPRPADIGAE
jgi:hypothetical protein